MAVALGALALFASGRSSPARWSDAPGRALLEYDRALAYLLALTAFATPPRTTGRVAWLLRGVLAGIVVVCGIGLITRVLPEVWPIRPGVADDRLSYPLTYWNAFGILSAVGTVLAFHLAAGEREPQVARVLGAAAVPDAGHGALLLLLARRDRRRRRRAAGLRRRRAPARAPGGARWRRRPRPTPALAAAYAADALGSDDFESAAGVAEGHDVALVLGLAMAGAAALRAILLPLDARLARARLPDRARRPVLGAAAAVLVVALVGVPLAAGAPGYVERSTSGSRSRRRTVESNRARASSTRQQRPARPLARGGSTPSSASGCTAPARAPTSSSGPSTARRVSSR